MYQNRTDQVISYINGLEGHQPVIVLILDAQTILDIAEAITKKGLNNVPIWIAATVGLRQMNVVQEWKRVFHGGVVLEPYLPELDQFQRYFTHALRVKLFCTVDNFANFQCFIFVLNKYQMLLTKNGLV